MKKREIYNYYMEKQGEGLFKAVGVWADGRLSYSMVDPDGEEVSGEESCYVQVRHDGKLVMIRL